MGLIVILFLALDVMSVIAVYKTIKKLARCKEKAEAKVTALVKWMGSDHVYLDDITVSVPAYKYSPQMTYRTKTGKNITAYDKTLVNGLHRFEIGETYQIMYDPKNPKTFIIRWRQVMSVIGTILCALILYAISVLVFFF